MASHSSSARQVVLIVEDETILMIDAVDMVEEAGFEAVEAINSEQAIRILRSRSDVSIVMTDIDMPGKMNGIELARYVREHWPPMGVLIVSGKTTVPEGQMPDRGVFIGKPLGNRSVGKVLNQLAA